MSERTGIGWTDHTFNVAWGCTEVSPGCDHCYARTFSERIGLKVWGVDAPRRLFGDKHWNEPLRWNREAERAGVRARVFCSSMADVFDAHPDIVAQLPRLWALIRATPMLDWQLLTKRHGRIARSLPWGAYDDPWPNVWLGVSAENREWWDRRVSVLKTIPAAVRWVSAEPLLENLHLTTTDLAGLAWIVFGAESGGKRRDCGIHALTEGVNACLVSRVAVFMKQDCAMKPGQQGRIPDWAWVHEWPVVGVDSRGVSKEEG